MASASTRPAKQPRAQTSAKVAPAETRVALVFLALALVTGGAVRLYSLVQMPFAFGDGGMFWVATRAIANANFALPATLAYPAPDANLPFCYPPMGFYAAAVLAKVGVPMAQIFRWLPWAWSMATIWAFWRLARTFWKPQHNGEWAAGAATLCWALLPWSFFWMVMGGGLTRALGMLCALLAIDAAIKLWRDGDKKQWIWLTVFLALALASHLERARFAAVAVGLVWLFYGLSPRGALQLASVYLGAALFTAPWWGLCLMRFGIAPFKAAASSGGSGWSESSGAVAVVKAVLFTINGEAILPFAHILGALGLIWCLSRRQWFLPMWALAILLIEVRSGRNFIIAPIALGVGILLSNAPRGRFIVMGLLTCWLCFLSLAVQSKRIGLTRGDLAAIKWAKTNAPKDARFLIIPTNDWAMDETAEWFPALANRASVTTVQGAEWLPDHEFRRRIARHEKLRKSQSWQAATATGLPPFDWVWRPNGAPQWEPDARWQKVWSSGNNAIWKRVE